MPEGAQDNEPLRKPGEMRPLRALLMNSASVATPLSPWAFIPRLHQFQDAPGILRKPQGTSGTPVKGKEGAGPETREREGWRLQPIHLTSFLLFSSIFFTFSKLTPIVATLKIA